MVFSCSVPLLGKMLTPWSVELTRGPVWCSPSTLSPLDSVIGPGMGK